MAKDEITSGPTPPYVPYKTFKSYLAKLKSTAIPPVIDNSVMSGLSGSTKSELRTAFRFLGLVDDSGAVTPDLRNLVDAQGTDTWKNTIGDRIFDSYASIIAPLDLDTATPQQLKDRFRNAGKVEGSVIPKAVRFFLSALEDSGTSFSPHFKVRGAGAVGGTTKVRSRVKQGGGKGGTTSDTTGGAGSSTKAPMVPDGSQLFTLPVKNKADAKLILPSDLSEVEWKMIDAYIRMFFSFPQKMSL